MNIINKKYHALSGYVEEFKKAKPFPYIVLDDFLDEEYFRGLACSYSDENNLKDGKAFDSDVETKKWISLNTEIPDAIREIVNELNSNEWVENLRCMTGIDTLIPTQSGNTKLANYHEMHANGFLAPHVDHSAEPETGLPHVLNIIVYLTEEWGGENGGATLLYDDKGKNIISKVNYKPNRAIIFLHTPYSFHCVERIKDDLNIMRKSLYVDYYSESFEPYINYEFSFPNRWFKHGTTFKLNHYFDYIKWKNINYTKAYLRYLFNKYI